VVSRGHRPSRGSRLSACVSRLAPRIGSTWSLPDRGCRLVQTASARAISQVSQRPSRSNPRQGCRKLRGPVPGCRLGVDGRRMNGGPHQTGMVSQARAGFSFVSSGVAVVVALSVKQCPSRRPVLRVPPARVAQAGWEASVRTARSGDTSKRFPPASEPPQSDGRASLRFL